MTNTNYLRIRASYFPIIETITTALPPARVNALLAAVIVDGIDRLMPTEEGKIPDGLEEKLREALQNRRYDQAADLGLRGLRSSVEGAEGLLFSTACLAAIRLAEPDTARAKCLRVLGTLALSRPRPEITAREIFKYREHSCQPGYSDGASHLK